MKERNILPFVSIKAIAYLALFLLCSVGIISTSVRTSAQLEVNAALTDNRVSESEILRRFDDWVERYLSGDFSGDRAFIQTGESLAAERRKIFEQLIRTNPQSAVEKTIPEEIQKQLPQSVVQFLEKSVSATGDFNVYAIDPLDSSKEHTENHRIEREVVIGDFKYHAFVYGRKTAMTTKLDTPLRGTVIDNLMAVDENSIRKIEPSNYHAYQVEASKLDEKTVVAEVGGKLRYFSDQTEFDKYTTDLSAWESQIAPVRNANLSSWTEGEKELLFIRVDFPDNQGVPIDRSGEVLTEAVAQNLINNTVNDFYVSNSYGKTSLRATVTPVVRMPRPQTDYPRENLYALLLDARSAARQAGFETDNYNLDMVAFSQSALLDFAGISPIGNKGALLNGSFTFKTTAHELGHEYGLLHANLWRTFDGTPTGSGTVVEYGDDFDMMGRGRTQATQFNANYKRSLNWLTEENIRTITQPGVYRLFAYDTPTLTAPNVRALRIKRDETKYFWLEFRQLLVNFPNLMNGALVHWDFPVNGLRQTQLLDMEPSTASLDDSSLLIGKTFADETSGVTITVLGKGNTTPESLDIKVDFNYSIINGAAFDFDGDGKSDIGVFRPSDGVWYRNNSTQGFNAAAFGRADDVIVPAKFNADRSTDIAVYRRGTWYVHNQFGNTIIVQFGSDGDIPVPADYDGDGVAEMTVFRPSNGTWYMWNWTTQNFSAVQFGASGDKPVPADYDGDGKTDVAVYRNGTWFIQRSSQGFTGIAFGAATDVPVPADYDSDGKTDIAVYRDGTWYLQRSTLGFNGTAFGLETDLPVPADYDGDGKTDIAVFRNGTWYLNRSRDGFTAVSFGTSGDLPIPNAFVP